MKKPEDDIVEYRADHIELDELELITQETEFYSVVVKKLITRGSKVIVGPRGVGKTHHMRIAHKQCLNSKTKPLSIYVTFSKYLRLEPLRGKSSIAIQFFHCWVLSKILLALRETCKTIGIDFPIFNSNDDSVNLDSLQLFCEQIEKQQQKDWHQNIIESVSVTLVNDIINEAILDSGRKHAILLCDDAALVLTKDYMVEFFDIFRSLNSSKISPKASVYPNTEFGPRFHLGHDAEYVPCWPSILSDDYEDLFDGIYAKRFTKNLKEDIKKCFIYASFGVPRAFLNLVNQFNLTDKGTDQQRVNAVIQAQAKLIREEFLTLAVKQPQFKNYVLAGHDLMDKLLKDVSKENQLSLKNGKKQIVIGIKQEHTPNKNINIIVNFFEETGLLQKATQVKHGTNRVYDRYVPHLTLLLSEGAFQRGHGGYVTNFSESINYPREKHPLRKNSFAEFSDPELLTKIRLNLPNCPACDTPRSNEEQKFCMFCGTELINKSTFETLMSNTVDTLPITEWLRAKIKQETSVETIGDIVLSSNPGQELRKAKGVGKYKATKVISEAQNWLDEYLQ
ncbi:hypothetical protein GCM10007978_07430 [Shewanella hanedai]|uniref:Zinc ribbon domain-containing protein n=1 Tax=Shewanella hanedai TaxID=25 RepID=A0A553JT30_SHEHA|nr:hypothetical protein [Shewanella hanedai]TRY15615.1 hypothetical protein FN961_03835 [Shewanella hanedai]GGI72024.1 hypothetical protein GCM10007978_07430 [Shewanella hanedai]